MALKRDLNIDIGWRGGGVEKAIEAVCYIRAQGLAGHVEPLGLPEERRNETNKAGWHWLWELRLAYLANETIHIQ